MQVMADRKRAVGFSGAPPVLVAVVALAASEEESTAGLVTGLAGCVPGDGAGREGHWQGGGRDSYKLEI